jgi:hypothetical protein
MADDFWLNGIERHGRDGAENAVARIGQLEQDLLWIAEFADVRSQDDSKTFARVNRGALRTIRDRAKAQALGEWVSA